MERVEFVPRGHDPQDGSIEFVHLLYLRDGGKVVLQRKLLQAYDGEPVLFPDEIKLAKLRRSAPY